MKTYITPALTNVQVENEQMLAASTLTSVDEGASTVVIIGGVIQDEEDFNAKGNDWTDIWE